MTYWYLIFDIDTEPDYLYYRLRGCGGRNEIFLGSVTGRSMCSSKCNENSDCVSFEWYGSSNLHPTEGANYCQLSSSCTYDISIQASPTYPSDLFVKGYPF